MKTFFRYWISGLGISICLAISVSIVVANLTDDDRNPEAVPVFRNDSSWTEQITKDQRFWNTMLGFHSSGLQLHKVQQAQQLLFVELSIGDTMLSWESIVADAMKQWFTELPDIYTIRCRVQNDSISHLIVIDRKTWVQSMENSTWSPSFIRENDLSNDKKTTD